MPHCCDEVHDFVPGGTLRQAPLRQNWPVLQSLLALHAGWQRPSEHFSPVRHCVSELHVRRGSQAPFRQLQLE